MVQEGELAGPRGERGERREESRESRNCTKHGKGERRASQKTEWDRTRTGQDRTGQAEQAEQHRIEEAGRATAGWELVHWAGVIDYSETACNPAEDGSQGARL